MSSFSVKRPMSAFDRYVNGLSISDIVIIMGAIERMLSEPSLSRTQRQKDLLWAVYRSLEIAAKERQLTMPVS